MTKNIVFFLNSLGGGGAERVASRLSFELVKKYNVYFFLIENSAQFYDCAGEIIVLGKKENNYLCNVIYAALNVNKYVKKYKIDCVISFLDVPNIINAALVRRTKRIISVRGDAETGGKINLLKAAKHKMCCLSFHKADALISVSKELTQIVKERYKIDDKSAYTIENPYNVETIVQCSKQDIEVELMDFILSHKTAISVGRIDHLKGYDDLIEIFGKVSEKYPDAGLLILGDGIWREKIEDLIVERGFQTKIKVLGIRKNPFAYMARCRLYVSASKLEGFPNTLVEAMACGLPVIQTDCKTGPREILSDNNISFILEKQYLEYGILIPSYTRNKVSREKMIEEYCSAWLRLLEDDGLVLKYSEKSKDRAKYYSMSACVEKYCNLIEQCR